VPSLIYICEILSYWISVSPNNTVTAVSPLGHKIDKINILLSYNNSRFARLLKPIIIDHFHIFSIHAMQNLVSIDFINNQCMRIFTVFVSIQLIICRLYELNAFDSSSTWLPYSKSVCIAGLRLVTMAMYWKLLAMTMSFRVLIVDPSISRLNKNAALCWVLSQLCSKK